MDDKFYDSLVYLGTYKRIKMYDIIVSEFYYNISDKYLYMIYYFTMQSIMSRKGLFIYQNNEWEFVGRNTTYTHNSEIVVLENDEIETIENIVLQKILNTI
jgi:hypothetical protein